MFWIVLAGVLVLALVLLGIVGYGVQGAFGRLGRELEAARRDARPVVDQVGATVAKAHQVTDAPANRA